MILFPVLFLALVLVRPKRFQTNGSWWQLQPLPSPWMTRIWRPLVRSFQCRQFGGLGKSKPNSASGFGRRSLYCHILRGSNRHWWISRQQRKEGMYLAISGDFHVNLQLIVKIILKRSTDSTYLRSMRRYQVSVLDKLSLTWDSSSWFHLKRATQLELSIQGKGSVSGGSQCRCESGNDSASGPRENREGAFRMDEGIEIYSHVVKQHFGHIVILATRFMMQ